MEYTEAEAERMLADAVTKPAARPVQGRYPVATASSTTERGGTIEATGGITTVGGRVALVGDLVRYPNGRVARIVSGAGEALRHLDRPVALVGSEMDNGDIVTSPFHNGLAIIQFADVPPIPGLFEPVSLDAEQAT